MPITDSTRVRDALAYVRRAYPALALDAGAILATVNHEIAAWDRLLEPDDILMFVPHIGGG